MKKVIVLTLFLCSFCSAYSQTDSLLLKNYEQKILENSKLQTDLQTEKQKNLDLSNAYKKDTLALQKQIKELRNEISSEKQKVSDLNKNKIKEEKDKLQTKVDSLNTVISTLNQTLANKEKQIASEKANANITVDKAKNDGKAETLASIVNSYKSRQFEDLIKSSTKLSVIRDIQLVGNNAEVKPILNNLSVYFNAEELLAKKFDVAAIKNAQTQLNQIKQKSALLDKLKENIEYYQDFNNALKETIGKLVNLDKRKVADGDTEIQKLKFNEIVTELTKYMYDYYDYGNYPYLSDIVLEIIKRKQPNADANISDLLKKL
ncbi:hypothetical protein SAMD00024442_11_47 [Candidatus Symbiothrix dinenymphae]|nr:hypothetical protein SAMD00024442_11_47 [Candidatus Symbiothrix dinenymphae]